MSSLFCRCDSSDVNGTLRLDALVQCPTLDFVNVVKAVIGRLFEAFVQ